MTALTERKDAALAVRWAREGVAFSNDDTTHALLADMLYAAHEYKDSVDEYRLALAGRPDDDTLKRGLERARKKLGAEKVRRAPHGKARVRQGGGGAGRAPTTSAGKSRRLSAGRGDCRRAEVAASPARDRPRSSTGRRAAPASAGSCPRARPRTSRRRCAGSFAAGPR